MERGRNVSRRGGLGRSRSVSEPWGDSGGAMPSSSISSAADPSSLEGPMHEVNSALAAAAEAAAVAAARAAEGKREAAEQAEVRRAEAAARALAEAQVAAAVRERDEAREREQVAARDREAEARARMQAEAQAAALRAEIARLRAQQSSVDSGMQAAADVLTTGFARGEASTGDAGRTGSTGALPAADQEDEQQPVVHRRTRGAARSAASGRHAASSADLPRARDGSAVRGRGRDPRRAARGGHAAVASGRVAGQDEDPPVVTAAGGGPMAVDEEQPARGAAPAAAVQPAQPARAHKRAKKAPMVTASDADDSDDPSYRPDDGEMSDGGSDGVALDARVAHVNLQSAELIRDERRKAAVILALTNFARMEALKDDEQALTAIARLRLVCENAMRSIEEGKQRDKAALGCLNDAGVKLLSSVVDQAVDLLEGLRTDRRRRGRLLAAAEQEPPAVAHAGSRRGRSAGPVGAGGDAQRGGIKRSRRAYAARRGRSPAEEEAVAGRRAVAAADGCPGPSGAATGAAPAVARFTVGSGGAAGPSSGRVRRPPKRRAKTAGEDAEAKRLRLQALRLLTAEEARPLLTTIEQIRPAAGTPQWLVLARTRKIRRNLRWKTEADRELTLLQAAAVNEAELEAAPVDKRVMVLCAPMRAYKTFAMVFLMLRDLAYQAAPPEGEAPAAPRLVRALLVMNILEVDKYKGQVADLRRILALLGLPHLLFDKDDLAGYTKELAEKSAAKRPSRRSRLGWAVALNLPFVLCLRADHNDLRPLADSKLDFRGCPIWGDEMQSWFSFCLVKEGEKHFFRIARMGDAALRMRLVSAAHMDTRQVLTEAGWWDINDCLLLEADKAKLEERGYVGIEAATPFYLDGDEGEGDGQEGGEEDEDARTDKLKLGAKHMYGLYASPPPPRQARAADGEAGPSTGRAGAGKKTNNKKKAGNKKSGRVQEGVWMEGMTADAITKETVHPRVLAVLEKAITRGGYLLVSGIPNVQQGATMGDCALAVAKLFADTGVVCFDHSGEFGIRAVRWDGDEGCAEELLPSSGFHPTEIPDAIFFLMLRGYIGRDTPIAVFSNLAMGGAREYNVFDMDKGEGVNLMLTKVDLNKNQGEDKEKKKKFLGCALTAEVLPERMVKFAGVSPRLPLDTPVFGLEEVPVIGNNRTGEERRIPTSAGASVVFTDAARGLEISVDGGEPGGRWLVKYTGHVATCVWRPPERWITAVMLFTTGKFNVSKAYNAAGRACGQRPPGLPLLLAGMRKMVEGIMKYAPCQEEVLRKPLKVSAGGVAGVLEVSTSKIAPAMLQHTHANFKAPLKYEAVADVLQQQQQQQQQEGVPAEEGMEEQSADEGAEEEGMEEQSADEGAEEEDEEQSAEEEGDHTAQAGGHGRNDDEDRRELQQLMRQLNYKTHKQVYYSAMYLLGGRDLYVEDIRTAAAVPPPGTGDNSGLFRAAQLVYELGHAFILNANNKGVKPYISTTSVVDVRGRERLTYTLTAKCIDDIVRPANPAWFS